MGRPRQTKVDAIRFVAYRDNESKQFESRREANIFASTARRSSRVEPIYYKARFWVLEVERVPVSGEESLDQADYTGRSLIERESTIKGPDHDALKARAEGLRRASFEREWLLFRKESNLRQLPEASRGLALECVEKFYERVDERIERKEADREQKRIQAAKQAALEAIPTVATLFQSEVKRKLAGGSIQQNTADVYLYESAAFDLETTTASGRKPLGDTQVHDVTRATIQEWFGVYAARPTRLGKLPTAKSCENVLSHLRTVGKALKKDDALSSYAGPYDVIEGLIEELKKSKGKGDGWRNRLRLTNDSVEKLIDACQNDVERAAVALTLAGSRPPSEPTALEWTHLERDDNGNLWWHVQASAIEQVGGKLDLRAHTKTKDVDYRQLSIAKRFVPWIETLRGRSDTYVLGDENGPMRPKDFTEMIESLIERAGIGGAGVSTYSLRHTAADEVERILGRSIRDLVLHGRRDRTTGSLHYSHAQRDRRRAELTIDSQPYGEHMVWANQTN